MRRSGNHAIQNWIIKQNNASFVHLNDIKIYTSQNPYESFSKATVSGISPLVYHQGIKKFRRYARYLQNRNVEYLYGGDRPELDRDKLRNYCTKSLIIHSYEHYSFNKAIGDWFEGKREDFLGRSQQKFDIIILRDPFNTFASLIRMGENFKNPDSAIEKWLEHAREYFGRTHHFKHRLGINYNLWFTDKDYRQEIANSLQLTFTDAGIRNVVNVGKGSSFDGTVYDGKAQEMPVLVRYKSYLEHPVMLKILANEELRELSTQIFGAIV